MIKVGVVLSGCGFQDGTEIHEAVLTILHLRKAGAEIVFYAPDTEQAQVVNHLTGKIDEGRTRKVMEESARITRGNIEQMFGMDADDLDAVIFPGGGGAAKNLSDFAFNEVMNQMVMDQMVVELHTEQLINAMFSKKKPMGFICITPVTLAALALKNKGLTLTPGDDSTMLRAIESTGHFAVSANAADIVVDEVNNIVSTPAYMNATDITQVDLGISKLVKEVLSRVQPKEAPKDEDLIPEETTELQPDSTA